VPGPAGAGSQPYRLHHRQPKREKRGKRGVCIDPHGFDGGKIIKGKKRHILVDTQGLLLHAIVHSAGIQDRDGGIMVLSTLFGLFPFLEKLFADSAYGGPIFHGALMKVLPQLTIEIVRRCDRAKGFVVLPKRWIVERTIAWLNRCRRLARDYHKIWCLVRNRTQAVHVSQADEKDRCATCDLPRRSRAGHKRARNAGQ
jgi:transposase